MLLWKCVTLLMLAGGPLRLHVDAEEAPPRGHLQPFGGWMDGKPIEERTDVPEPEEFYEQYCNSDQGYGKPVVFRGAAKQMEAMEWTSDEFLLERYGNARITGVEHNLKESRTGGNVEGMDTLRNFLNAYNTSDIYMVSDMPREMQKEVKFLPCLRCGGYLDFLDQNILWFGRGGSKSVIHSDAQDNINCMIAGQKRFIFAHPSYRKSFEASANKDPKNRFGWVDTSRDESMPGYGAFFGLIDIDRMDLIKYPGWREVEWSYVDLLPGDCVYIPFQWYHQVTAEPVRSINIQIWYWRPGKFDAQQCAAAENDKSVPTFAQCTWGFEPESGHLGLKKKGWKKPTKCKGSKRRKKVSRERTDL